MSKISHKVIGLLKITRTYYKKAGTGANNWLYLSQNKRIKTKYILLYSLEQKMHNQ